MQRVIQANSECIATEIDYFITNVEESKATAEWIINTYKEQKLGRSFLPLKPSGWLGLKEDQVRDKRSLVRHLMLVFCAYTFIIWQKLTGGCALTRG